MGGGDTSECTAVGARESKQTGQRHGKDIIREHEHASCVTHECHLLQFKTLRTEEQHREAAREGEKRKGHIQHTTYMGISVYAQQQETVVQKPCKKILYV